MINKLDIMLTAIYKNKIHFSSKKETCFSLKKS